ncbi:MAG: FAD-dependent thymidylate synthase, partial [Candidatus Kariarchaeaceae archaeon]
KQIETYFAQGMSLYQHLLDNGVAKECARFVLPLATPTRLYMSGSCRSWIHYIQLRSANGTQKEHMEIAEACKQIFAEQFPTVAEALEWV